MKYIVREKCWRDTFCAVCWPVHRIAQGEECWFEPVRKWECCLAKGEKFDRWIGIIEESLKTKTPIREAMKNVPGATVAPEPPLCTQTPKVVEFKPRKPVQGSLF